MTEGLLGASLSLDVCGEPPGRGPEGPCHKSLASSAGRRVGLFLCAVHLKPQAQVPLPSRSWEGNFSWSLWKPQGWCVPGWRMEEEGLSS